MWMVGLLSFRHSGERKDPHQDIKNDSIISKWFNIIKMIQYHKRNWERKELWHSWEKGYQDMKRKDGILTKVVNVIPMKVMNVWWRSKGTKGSWVIDSVDAIDVRFLFGLGESNLPPRAYKADALKKSVAIFCYNFVLLVGILCY